VQESELLHELDVLHEEPRAALSSASSSSSGVRLAPTRAYKHQLNLVKTCVGIKLITFIGSIIRPCACCLVMHGHFAESYLMAWLDTFV